MKQRFLPSALVIAVLIAILWFLLGTEKEFNIIVVNTNAHSIKYVITRFPGYEFPEGILLPRSGGLGGVATYGGHVGPWPSALELEWAFEQNPQQVLKKELKVPKMLRASVVSQK